MKEQFQNTIDINPENRKALEDAKMESVKTDLVNQLNTDNGAALIPEKLATKEFPAWAMYLTPPHGRMIWDLKKDMLIKTDKFKKHINENLLLCSGNLIYAIIRLSEGREIDLEQFKKLEPRHRLSEADRKKWWPKRDKLNAYDVTIVHKFKKPVKYVKIKGFQNFVQITKIKLVKEFSISDWAINYKSLTPEIQNSKLTDIHPVSLKGLKNQELIFVRLRLKQISQTVNDDILLKAHAYIMREMRKRKIEISIKDDFDKLTLAFEKKNMPESNNDFRECVKKLFISMEGMTLIPNNENKTLNIKLQESGIAGDIIEYSFGEINVTNVDGKISMIWENPKLKEITQKSFTPEVNENSAEEKVVSKMEGLEESSYGKEEIKEFNIAKHVVMDPWVSVQDSDYEESLDVCDTVDFEANTLEEHLASVKVIEPSIDEIKKITGQEGGAFKGKYNPYLVTRLKKEKNIIQEHWRGLTEEEAKTGKAAGPPWHSSHTDIRWVNTKDYALGITLNTPGSTNPKERNKLIDHQGNERIMCELKNLIPLGWVNPKNFPHVAEPGGVGATSNAWARIFVVDSGSVEYYPYKEHFLEFIISDKKVKGRWILTYVPVPKEMQKEGEPKRVWLLSKPQDQRPYYEKHPEALEIIKERQKKFKEKGVI